MIPIRTMACVLLGVTLVGCGRDDAAVGKAEAARLSRVAQAVAREEDRIAASDLASWIIEGRKDFRLVDVRPAAQYARAHIEGAENISIPELVLPQRLQTLPRDRRIVVYSSGSENAAAAAVMLRLAGRDAAFLVGGYNFWHQRILNPDIPETAAAGEIPQIAQQRAIACYFAGGSERPRATPTVAVQQPPPVPSFVPPLRDSAPMYPPPAGKEEGC